MTDETNPRITDTIEKIVAGPDVEIPLKTNEMGETEEVMIPQSVVDQYIQDTINARWADKVRMEKEAKEARRKLEETAIEEYTGVMKDSDEPWVDLKGYTETPNGLKISLDWNDAFIEHLKEQGMKGADEEQIVHTWLGLLMKSVATDTTKGDFED